MNNKKFQHGDLVKIVCRDGLWLDTGMVLEVKRVSVMVRLTDGRTAYPKPEYLKKITSDTNAL
jgi:hypothetical protein